LAYLLRSLILIMLISIFIVVFSALNWINIEKFNHIALAIPSFVFLIFAQAFVMFYFIGVHRLTENVYRILHSKNNLEELFDSPPKDLSPYVEKVNKFLHQTGLSKRQTIPWTMLMLILGSLGFLLGGAHHTGLVQKIIHSGVIYGFLVAMSIGFVRQWYYLGKSHKLLRELKTLFQIPDGSM